MKKLLIALLAGLMSMSCLVACNGLNNTSSSNETSESSEQTENSSEIKDSSSDDLSSDDSSSDDSSSDDSSSDDSSSDDSSSDDSSSNDSSSDDSSSDDSSSDDSSSDDLSSDDSSSDDSSSDDSSSDDSSSDDSSSDDSSSDDSSSDEPEVPETTTVEKPELVWFKGDGVATIENGTLTLKERYLFAGNGIENGTSYVVEATFNKSGAAEYGFIFRYPSGKSHITGMSSEPSHLRYVGIELAQALKELNITLEEYHALYK